MLVALKFFSINMIPYLYARWKVLMGFVTLSKQESAIKIGEALGLADFLSRLL